MSEKLLGKIILRGFTIFLVLITTLPFLAPLFAYFGYRRITDVIYEIYSYSCHQKAHRSLFIFDEQCAWCIRDTFIWTALTTVWFVSLMNFNKTFEGLRIKTAILLCIPMAIDGTVQLIAAIISSFYLTPPFYESTNTLRAFTGGLFGIGLGLYMFPRLIKELRHIIK